MTYSIYIDYTDEYIYDDYETCNQLVSRKLGVEAKFLCNSYAKISNGDVFEIIFDSAEDATIFSLKCNCPIIDRSLIENYKNRNKKRDLQWSPFF